MPVVVLEDQAAAPALGEALKAGGLPIAEVTFRTEAAADALQILAEDDDLLVGAGTVVTPAQVDRAAAAGARFIVSPGLSPAVVRRAQALGLPAWPGVATPSDVMAALDLGLQTVKLFPAGLLGGVQAVRALAGPFPDLRLIPTGGIGPADLAGYLGLRSVVAVGGSWMVSPSLLAARDFATVTRLCAEAVGVVRAIEAARRP
jgi:2-dehydro-3-deoxyphosphogluconate aldolase/(4S)-4-hydroxy-2-oxoglutarate aldolase